MKAFIVQEHDEGRGGVFFANHDIVAKKAGLQYLDYDETELSSVSCHRCPALDDMEQDPRTVTRHLLNIGWWFDEGQITSDDNPFVAQNGEVYRTWSEWLEERTSVAIRIRQRKAAEKELWGKWPWAEDIRVHIEPSGMMDAEIKLPYLQHGRIRYLERENRHFCPRGDLLNFLSAYTINRDSEHLS